jgi:hypothetical protein
MIGHSYINLSINSAKQELTASLCRTTNSQLQIN